jgi:hypothetical protein
MKICDGLGILGKLTLATLYCVQMTLCRNLRNKEVQARIPVHTTIYLLFRSGPNPQVHEQTAITQEFRVDIRKLALS